MERTVLEERDALSMERLASITKEHTAQEPFGDYFRKTASFVIKMDEVYRKIKDGKTESYTLEQWQAFNQSLYEDILPENYEHSYGNPKYAVEKLGEVHGRILSFLYAELYALIGYAFEQRLHEKVILQELLIEVYNCFEEEELPGYRRIQQIIYWFESDYSEITVAHRIREAVDPKLDFAAKIVMESDLKDLRYLYRYGEYITENERKMAEFMNSLDEETVEKMASTFTEGYRIGFEVNEKDLKKKRTVNIRYCLGFERIIRQAVKNFEEMGLESIIYRAAVSRVNMREANKIGYYSSSPNRQYDYDHKGDAALFLDKAFVERKLGVMRTTYEQYKELAAVHGGPAVMEIFGETPFEPAACPEAYKLADRQQENQVLLYSKSGQMTNEYIKGEERSFTIIAFPVPDIGDKFEEIFRETVKINTLDYRTWQRIQQCMIDVLDTGEKVHITGSGENRTDLYVALASVKDPAHETVFENCVADVNIPVGEVFTSPKLTGTTGLLHVSGVYLDGLYYKDLVLSFTDGMVTDYDCGNYENTDENRRYIRENVLYHHDTLPMGEFAIGTNTTAYVAARKYGIEALMPILIAEKTGPHFAVGDTCYSWEEDVVTHNPDGKKIIAKENECSALRRKDPGKAYFNCHTDITIPYEELDEIAVIQKDGTKVPIIQKGRFVLPGTEELNVPLDEWK